MKPTNCGGEGDCGDLSITSASWGVNPYSEEDVAPGGKLQAFSVLTVRLQNRSNAPRSSLLSREGCTRLRMSSPLRDAERDGISLFALSAAMKTEFRVWAWGDRVLRDRNGMLYDRMLLMRALALGRPSEANASSVSLS